VRECVCMRESEREKDRDTERNIEREVSSPAVRV
jgi:hypothetical protein